MCKKVLHFVDFICQDTAILRNQNQPYNSLQVLTLMAHSSQILD